MALPVIFAALFALERLPSSRSISLGIGTATVPLTFLVVDAHSGRPIEGASVELTDEGASALIGTTGLDGHVKLSIVTSFTVSWDYRGRLRHRSVNYSR